MGDFGSIDWTKTKFNIDPKELPSTSLPGIFKARRAGNIFQLFLKWQ